MASTSSAASSTSTAATSDYDVFINHRGPDVKKTLASHLYRRLLSHGVRAFLDQQELQRGDDLTSQIVGAIGSASVHVAILSEGYAESTWCLKELLLMLESKAPVIPVFYRVKPHELRYGQAIQTLEKKMEHDPQTQEEKRRHDSATIENWRKALSRVAGISGFELEACNGDEGELVDMVVKEVLEKVKKPALNVAKYPTGLDDKVKDLENTVLLQLQQSGKPRILGIVGLGGVGKTTLAKEFFNRKSSDYSKTCFLADVRENASKRDLILLQKKLLRSLNASDNIDGVDEGIGMLSKHLSSSRALIILDDVDHLNQVDALLPHQSVHSDSLVVITSRDKDVLTRSKVENTSIYKLTGLDTQQSQELFCSHAFNQLYPQPGFESLVLEFLKRCNGLPLSLKVFGALLYGKDISEWEDELESLRQILPRDIQQSLKISYNSLHKDEQQIFLDIACFFRGENMDRAIRIWDSSYLQGRRRFENLRNKCLVEVDSENNIQIHDHLRDMGREIAEEPELPRRLWRWTKKTIEPLLQQSLNGQVIPVRGIRMVQNDIDDDDALNCIPMMMGLQLLDTEDFLLERILTKVQRPNLLWLRWNNYSGSSSLPSSISMKNLRVLQLHWSKSETLWENEFQAPLQLRELQVRGPLSNIPESIGKLNHLERIVLDLYGSNLTKLPEEFCLLQSLKTLEIQHCKMKSLPDSFGNLTNLQQITLSWCYELDTLPDSFGNLTNLRHIDLSRCSELHTLPEEFCLLQSLKTLVIRHCKQMKSLPDSFGNLTNLQQITLSQSYELDTLPDSFGNLTNLRHIDLSGCSELHTLPDSFGNLTNLRHIDLSQCRGLHTLPDSCGNLTNLRHIDLSQCSELHTLPESFGNVTNLRHIALSRCSDLHTLPDSFGNVTNLRHIDLSRCSELHTLPDSFGNLTNLVHINLSGCFRLDTPPHCFGKLINLQYLNLESCSKLTISSETIGNISTLEYVNLSCCIKMKVFPPQVAHQRSLQRLLVGPTNIKEMPSAIGELNNLEFLQIGGPLLDTLPPSLCHLKNLKGLKVIRCRRLKCLPASLGDLRNLKKLNIEDCKKLKCLPASIGQLCQLTELRIARCPLIRELSFIKEVKGERETLSDLESSIDNCILPRLQRLTITETGILTRLQRFTITETGILPQLQRFTVIGTGISEVSFAEGVFCNLRDLYIEDCDNVVEVGTLPNTLIKLSFLNCHNLRKIDKMCGLAKLQKLRINACIELEELPPIGTLVSLRLLDATDCRKLKSIRGMGQLTNLEYLDVSGCSELEEVEGIQHCISLNTLNVCGCVKLKSIRGMGQLTNLQELIVSGCSELEEVEGIQHCRSLWRIDASSCVKLKSIRGLGQLAKLQYLFVNDCSELEEVEGIQHCMSLLRVAVYGCPKLQWSAEVKEQLSLKSVRVDVSGCAEVKKQLPWRAEVNKKKRRCAEVKKQLPWSAEVNKKKRRYARI